MFTPALSNRRILVVEDDFFIAMDMDMTLQAAQATVLGPTAAVQASLDLMADQPDISAAVLDVNLRGELVFPVADALLARGVPFIFATSEDPHMIPRRFAGVTVCSKPVAAADLVQRVVDLLEA